MITMFFLNRFIFNEISFNLFHNVMSFIKKSLLFLFLAVSVPLFSQNYSLSFDGQDNRLDLPMINDLKSLAFWVKISSY
jgi:hypothetical protein